MKSTACRERLQIDQDLSRTTGKIAQNEHGFLLWPIELPAYGRHTIRLVYTVSRKRDVEGL